MSTDTAPEPLWVKALLVLLPLLGGAVGYTTDLLGKKAEVEQSQRLLAKQQAQVERNDSIVTARYWAVRAREDNFAARESRARQSAQFHERVREWTRQYGSVNLYLLPCDEQGRRQLRQAVTEMELLRVEAENVGAEKLISGFIAPRLRIRPVEEGGCYG